MVRTKPPEPAPSRERLLAAARELFAARGFSATGTRAIAAHAGCNLSLIKYYFESKEGLLREVVRSTAETIAAELRNLLAEPVAGEERLRRFLEFMVGFLSRNQDFVRLVFREAVLTEGPLVDEIAPMMVGNHALGSAILEGMEAEGRLRDVEPRVAVVLAMGMMIFPFLASPVVSRLLGPMTPELVERLRRNVAEVFLHGVLGGPGTTGEPCRPTAPATSAARRRRA